MPTITNRIPYPLSQRIATVTQNLFARQGREVDVAIGGVPFRLATSGDLPYTIETVPVRKDQVDVEPDPGEQSLAVFWRRAQASWHEGAGLLYQESSESVAPSHGFFDSRGVDVFTPGRLTLLKRMEASPAVAFNLDRLRAYVDAGTYKLSAVGTGELCTSPSFDGTFTALHSPVSETVVDGLISGDRFYDIVDEGKLYRGTIASPSTADWWTLGGTPTRLMWGKHRLWIIGGRKIWQPDLSIADEGAQTEIWETPNEGFTYTCMAEGPAAMYFGGHDGRTSFIQLITLESDGGTPTLSGAAVAATLPDGELVEELAVMAGQFIGIGTNLGFRIGALSQDGSITYGPLMVEPEGVSTCTALTTQGRFFLVAFDIDGDTGRIFRVDTSVSLEQDGVFAYASDADTGVSGHVTSIAAGRPGDLAVSMDSGDTYYQHATDFVDSGYVQSGRIRFRTTERKNYRFVQIEAEPLAGRVSIEAVKEGGSTIQVGSLTKQGAVVSDKYAINSDPVRYVSVKLTLTPNDTGDEAPVINSYQLAAWPAIKPQRLITLPLLCFDREKSLSGQQYGGDGFAADRLAALQAIEDQAGLVTFQDFTLSQAGNLVTIERIRFVMTGSLSSSQGSVNGPGGILIVELRTTEE